MARVVCPSCKSAFEASISRDDYTLNCATCGVAFNAAQYLPDQDFRAICERRPQGGTRSHYDRGTHAAGNVIRPVDPPAPPAAPASPETKTGGLPFEEEDSEPAPSSVPASSRSSNPFAARMARRNPIQLRPEHVPEAAIEDSNGAEMNSDAGHGLSVPPAAPSNDPPKSFLEASVTTSRFKPLRLLRSEREAARQARKEEEVRDRTGAVRVLVNGAEQEEAAPAPKLELPAPRVHLEEEADEVAPAAPEPASPAPKRTMLDGADEPEPPAAPAPSRESQRGKRPPVLEGRFGPYEIECEIARGGVGAVLKAYEPKASRHVALKVLLDGDEADEVDRERFQHECETAKALALPGMIEIFDVGELDGRPFMAMELIEGKSLDKLIREQALTIHEGLAIMQSVAETVGRLHEAGYVHRDLKPGNILLDRYGAPKVADFGLVKSLDEVTRLTASGLVCGTPAYMAPEQARGESAKIDPRTDVWALGAVLYELLTGEAPFQAENALRLMLQITKETPRRPRLLNSRIPKEVEAIVLKCLEKNGERRYANGTALGEDLRRFLQGAPVEAQKGQRVTQWLRTVRENRSLAWKLGLGLAAVVLVGVLVRVALAPREAGTLTERGWQALRARRMAEAEAAFRKALDLDASHAGAYLGLSQIVGLQGIDRARKQVRDPERFNEALALATRAAEADPALKSEAAVQRASLFMLAGRFGDEVRERENVVALRSDQPRHYQALALAYWNLGAQGGGREYYEKAQRAFHTVLNLQQDYPQTREHLKRLQEQFLIQRANVSGNQRISASER
ncbi:MAG: protein kinase [Planctomycetota bacterium]|nr:protein kinase [Planctomycetota bacterium]